MPLVVYVYEPAESATLIPSPVTTYKFCVFEIVNVYVPVVAKKPEPDVTVILYTLPASELGAETDDEPPPLSLLLLQASIVKLKSTIIKAFIFFIFISTPCELIKSDAGRLST